MEDGGGNVDEIAKDAERDSVRSRGGLAEFGHDFGGCLKGEGIDGGLESFLELLKIGFLGLAARGGFAPNRLPGILQGCCDAT